MRSREPAICLRTTDYSETSQVVHFLTRQTGVVRLLAKGTKRPKSKSGGAIDLLSEGDLLFSAKDAETLGVLMEFSETSSHTALRRDAKRLNTALYMLELVHEMLAEGDPHPAVFDLLHRALQRLGQEDAPVPAVLAYFQWRLLRHVGLLGGLDACVSCGLCVGEMSDRAGVYFSSRLGGLLCDGCEGSQREKFHLEPATLEALATLAVAEVGRRVSLPDPPARSVNRLLGYHIAQQLGKRLKMARHVLGELGDGLFSNDV
ncbi:MAG: DNA repair protein RecO [Phycisphaerae bacterium]|nr:DNA repair protein RecO [Phycisphaerae bacterium]